MKESLPILLLKKLVLLPNQEVRLEINNDVSKSSIDNSIESNNSNILVISPLNVLEEHPSIKDLPKVGVIGKIKTKIKLPNGDYRIIIKGNMNLQANEILNKCLKKVYELNLKNIRVTIDVNPNNMT